MFEIETSNLFTKKLNFSGQRLEESNKPDVIIFYKKYGTIIDYKSYKKGFLLDKKCSDEMQRYIIQNKNRYPGVPINEWWKKFDQEINDFFFLFITSKLIGAFKKNINELALNTGVKGGAIGVENLLYLAEKLKAKEISYDGFFDLLNNDEIII